jgi:thiamine biosynthesis lipoprotein
VTGVDVTETLRHDFRAMASGITLTLVEPTDEAAAGIELAEGVFRRVESACTRFDPQSPLMQANADPRHWHRVPVELYDAVAAAATAHADTDGLFDPRVLRTLVSYGYDRTLPFETDDVSVPTGGKAPGASRRRWRPSLDADGRRIRLGRDPIDLGGIGKGLAVRWAGRPLRPAADSTLIEAGGDCLALGRGPEGDGWRIAVEDPFGADEPVAVLRLTNKGVATSSTRIRRWHVDGRPVHHLIDPRTGAPADSGLASVTVVDNDPARAEVWSKSLFVLGAQRLAAEAASRGLAALWVTDDGKVGTSRAMLPLVMWQVHHVG